MHQRIVRFACLVLAFSLIVGAVVATAEDKPGEKKMTPEQQAMMEAWMKVATPNENHKALEPFVGTFNAKMTTWETPGQPPEVSTGVSQNTWVLGGRFVQQTFDGTAMGQPFHGIGFTGYDNFKKKYTGTWMDNMGTMTLWMTGSAEPGGKVWDMQGTMDDIMTGKPTTIRSVTRLVDHNQHVYEMYGPDPAGKEYKMFEIVYTRK